MTSIVIYSLIAALILILAAVLVRQRLEGAAAEGEGEANYLQGLLDGSCLSLAERIFDPADYLWLRYKIGYPQLARELASSRKKSAVRWLKALGHSFNELLRVPEPSASRGDDRGGPESWGLLWLTLRFHLLLAYALFVVRLFGPYHRLIPSFTWVETLTELNKGKDRYESADTGRLR